MRLYSCIHVAYTCKHVNEYLQVINAPDLFVQELVTVTVESMKICTDLQTAYQLWLMTMYYVMRMIPIIIWRIY